MSTTNIHLVHKIITSIKHAHAKKRKFILIETQFLSGQNLLNTKPQVHHNITSLLNLLVRYGIIYRWQQMKPLADKLKINSINNSKLILWLPYQLTKPATDLKMYIRPGHMQFWDVYKLSSKNFKAFPIIYVLSTNLGLMTHIEALNKRVGGIPLFYIRLK